MQRCVMRVDMCVDMCIDTLMGMCACGMVDRAALHMLLHQIERLQSVHASVYASVHASVHASKYACDAVRRVASWCGGVDRSVGPAVRAQSLLGSQAARQSRSAFKKNTSKHENMHVSKHAPGMQQACNM